MGVAERQTSSQQQSIHLQIWMRWFNPAFWLREEKRVMEREWHSYRSKDSSSSPTLAQLYMHRHAGLGTDEEWELKNNRLKLFLTHLQRREIQCRVFFFSLEWRNVICELILQRVNVIQNLGTKGRIVRPMVPHNPRSWPLCYKKGGCMFKWVWTRKERSGVRGLKAC